LWVAQIAVAGILGMAAFAKLFAFTAEGSLPLAEALGVGRGVITTMGLYEVVTVLLILLPRTRAIGAIFAVFNMLGALGAHFTVIGFSGNPAADMWPLAFVVLALAGFVAVARRNELPSLGGR
jgi:hypothetical protein